MYPSRILVKKINAGDFIYEYIGASVPLAMPRYPIYCFNIDICVFMLCVKIVSELALNAINYITYKKIYLSMTHRKQSVAERALAGVNA